MAVSVTFAVYKKHYPPALHDEVWRLDKIEKLSVYIQQIIILSICFRITLN